jgi:hypothetical protein
MFVVKNLDIFKFNSAIHSMSCRQIFKDYNILTVAALYIFEVICFIKKYKDFMAKNVNIHNYNTRRKLNLHVNHCNTVKKRCKYGYHLYNKVPEQIKIRKHFNSFKRDLKPFLLKYSIYSVDEFMSLKV